MRMADPTLAGKETRPGAVCLGPAGMCEFFTAFRKRSHNVKPRDFEKSFIKVGQ